MGLLQSESANFDGECVNLQGGRKGRPYYTAALQARSVKMGCGEHIWILRF